jgi:hypothetical protein
MTFSPCSSTRISATPVAVETVVSPASCRRAPAELVVADRADERRRDAEAGRRNRLIAALAAVVDRELGPGQGFARGGKAIRASDEIDVDGSDNHNPRADGARNVAAALRERVSVSH